jgi:Fic family protein
MKTIEALHAEWQKLQPLSPENQKKLDQKFMLDFNFNSNHLEGNTLTYGQTKLLLIFGDTTGDAKLRDYEEMKAHNVGLELIKREALDKMRPLTESFIRDLNRTIMVENFWKAAKTPNGEDTRMEVQVGAYKTRPNSVITSTGEEFEYASPQETPAMMADLVAWYNAEGEKGELSPIELAALFHYRYIRIHPFEDGNGRIARLLVNYILHRHGYPMVVVRSDDKESYLRILHQCDVQTGLQPADGANASLSQIKPFTDYLGAQLQHALELGIKAAKGESLEEPDDLDKKLALLQQEIEAEGDDHEIRLELTRKVIVQLNKDWIFKLITSLDVVSRKFENFYFGFNTHVIVNTDNVVGESRIDNFINYFGDSLPNRNNTVYKVSIDYKLNTGPYKKGGAQPFNCNYNVEITLSQLYYEIGMPVFNQETKGNDYKMIVEKRLLHKPLLETEKEQIIKLWGESLFNYLDHNRNQLNTK